MLVAPSCKRVGRFCVRMVTQQYEGCVCLSVGCCCRNGWVMAAVGPVIAVAALQQAAAAGSIRKEQVPNNGATACCSSLHSCCWAAMDLRHPGHELPQYRRVAAADGQHHTCCTLTCCNTVFYDHVPCAKTLHHRGFAPCCHARHCWTLS